MKLLLTGAFKFNQEQLDTFKSLSYEVTFVQDERISLDIDVSEFEAVVCNSLFLYNDITRFENLKFIQLTSAGLDRVPLDYIKEHEIKIFNARGVYSIPMAEFAISGVLDLYKHKFDMRENQRSHQWIKYRELTELYGKTVCIVGCGNVGQECAKRFKAFGCKVIGIDIVSSQNEYFEKISTLDQMDIVLPECDVTVLTLPLTEQTKNLFDLEKFNKMKYHSILVNIARGGIVNTEDLIHALNNNIGGAVLDVFNTEPLGAESPLWDMKNVVITPHNSFVGDGNNERIFKLIKKNLEELA